MATLLEHSAEIEAEFKAALADKVITFREGGTVLMAIVGAVICTYDKLTDKTQFSALVTEGEALYEKLVNPANFDIPRVPEAGEILIVKWGKMAIRPLIEWGIELMDGVQ